jgi:ubiquinone/menaquinone biosynthesis C-methylase UbiE
MHNQVQSPHYGIDAPGLVGFFLSTGGVMLVIFLALVLAPFSVNTWARIFGGLSAIAAAYFLGMGCLMLYFSKVTKLKEREKLLNLIEWSGRELVLDVGCGRGLMLVGAAKRLSSGKAIGIDIWQQKDQAKNSASAVLANAEYESVKDRVEVKTADMRQLPFPENHFDVVVSNWAVHNLELETDRQNALSEIVRVLKPGGVVVLSDIAHQAQYAKYLGECGMVDVQLHSNALRDSILRPLTHGNFVPSAVSARKAAAIQFASAT